MTPKKKLFLSTNLYLIINIKNYRKSDFFYKKAQQALSAGAKILQLRCKDLTDCEFLEIARSFRKLTGASGAIFIVNDRVDIALSCGADGVHLGQDDLPLSCAKNILGKKKIFGKSTHSLEQAQKAQSEGADYIGFGPIFKTNTKLGERAIGLKNLKLLTKMLKVPFFALGGIDHSNVKTVIAEGVEKIAVSNAVFAKKNIRKALSSLNALLKK